jgi:hypothetical protein
MGGEDEPAGEVHDDGDHYRRARAGAEVDSAIGVGVAVVDRNRSSDGRLDEATVGGHLGVTLEDVAEPRMVVERDGAAEGVGEGGVGHSLLVNLPSTSTPGTSRQSPPVTFDVCHLVLTRHVRD